MTNNAPQVPITDALVTLTPTNTSATITHTLLAGRTVDQQISYDAMKANQAAAIVGFVAAIVAGVQAWLIRKQIRLAAQANSNALEELKKGQDQAERSFKLSEHAIKMAEQSVAVTVENNRLDNRAWLSTESVTGRFEDVSHEKTEVVLTFSFKNSGKTPTKSAKIEFEVVHGPRIDWDEAKKNFAVKITPNASALGYIVADKEMPISVILDRKMVDGYRSGQTKLGILAKVTYVDIFGVEHISENGWEYSHHSKEFLTVGAVCSVS